jgi:hypothetical protein
MDEGATLMLLTVTLTGTDWNWVLYTESDAVLSPAESTLGVTVMVTVAGVFHPPDGAVCTEIQEALGTIENEIAVAPLSLLVKETFVWTGFPPAWAFSAIGSGEMTRV